MGGLTASSVVPNGNRVAVVGAGPAGLSCANYLARLGYEVEIHDRARKPGGVLSHAIPGFRLPDDVIDRELAAIHHPGMSYRLGVELGPDVALSELERDYDAVFLAAGLSRGRRIDIPGAEKAQIRDALSLLERLRAGTPIEVGDRVLVIGGGSVASDVALSLRRGGVADVTVVCLEGESEMPALASELDEMTAHGVTIEPGWGPSVVTSPTTIEFRRCTAVSDDAGRFAPVFDESSTMSRSFDQLVLAIGQELDPELSAHLGPAVGPDGLVQVDGDTLRVRGSDRIFAGGDIIRGAGTVVEAIADGRRAAAAMHEAIRLS
jgi:NADPH-dependent glutamate synthase beta subunit-like oxidoreductase